MLCRLADAVTTQSTAKQASKQAGRQASKQAGKQASKQASKQHDENMGGGERQADAQNRTTISTININIINRWYQPLQTYSPHFWRKNT